MTAPDLITFLTARLDEEAAREAAASRAPWSYGGQGWVFAAAPVKGRPDNDFRDLAANTFTDADADFIAATRNTALATIAAHRAIVERYRRAVAEADTPWRDPSDPNADFWRHTAIALRGPVLDIAAIYATHADYQQEWRVT